MALDSTVGGASANSYASVVEADAYFAPGSHLQGAPWAAIEEEEVKEAALISATRWIEGLRFWGRKATSTQALRFPRCYKRLFVPGVIPPRLKQAVFEQALHLAGNPAGVSARQKLQAEGVTQFTIGELTEVFGGPRVNSGTVENHLSDAARAALRGYINRTGRFCD